MNRSHFLFLMAVAVTTIGCQQRQNPSHQLKPVVDKYIEIWRTGNVDELDSIVDPKFVRHSDVASSVEGIDQLKKLIKDFRNAYPDLQFDSKDEIYSENKFAGRWTFAGTNTGKSAVPAGGNAVRLWGINILHFENGKITEEWDGFDNVPFLAQRGYTIAPPDSK